MKLLSMSLSNSTRERYQFVFVLPVKNEAAVIERTVRVAYQVCTRHAPTPWRLVVADNGSTDDTADVVTHLADNLPNLIIQSTSVSGKGYALKRAWESVSAVWYGFTDADLSVDLETALPRAFALLSAGADVAAGSRATLGAEVNRPIYRRLVSATYRIIARLVTGTKLHDLPCGFKIVNERIVREIVPLVQNDSWFFDSELMLRSEAAGDSIVEFPVHWEEYRYPERYRRLPLLRTSFQFLRALFAFRYQNSRRRSLESWIRIGLNGAVFVFCLTQFILIYFLEVILAPIEPVWGRQMVRWLREITILLNVSIILAVPLLLAVLCSCVFIGGRLRWLIKSVFAAATTLIYAIITFLLLYHYKRGTAFDPTFFWDNRSVAALTLIRSFPVAMAIVALLLILALAAWYRMLGAISVKVRQRKPFVWALALVTIASLVSQANTFQRLPTEPAAQLYRLLFTVTPLGSYYQRLYNQHFIDLTTHEARLPATASPALLGDAIFILHLESLNAEFVSERVTPNLLRLDSDGIRFPNFYSSSVQTNRALESILCGLPPTLGRAVIDAAPVDKIARLPCLPRLLSQLGYRTFYFKDDSLAFARSGEFATAIGFTEVHAEDISAAGDPTTPWGYREDVFIKRIMEYLQRYKDQRVFVYIALNATNHHPFTLITDDRIRGKLLYPNPVNFEELRANATYAQDVYLGDFIKEWQARYGPQATLIVLGDHPWPTPRHNNIHNEIGGYEENFLTTLTFVPPASQRDRFSIGRISAYRYGQTDILPTIIELFVPGTQLPVVGTSFVSELIVDDDSAPLPETLSAQPYNGGVLAFVRYPTKYLFDVGRNIILRYALDLDPDERFPTVQKSPADSLMLLDAYFNRAHERVVQ